jgi:hypothetical protein
MAGQSEYGSALPFVARKPQQKLLYMHSIEKVIVPAQCYPMERHL